MTALTANNIVLVPIRSGVGFRLGANIGYLKFTPKPTWNPFWAARSRGQLFFTFGCYAAALRVVKDARAKV